MKHSIESDDDLRASNALLKLKLELEHGMQMHDTTELPPDVENQWLQNIYEFERQYKDAVQISVWEFIGRPDFVKWESLTEDQLREAIEDLMNRMEQKGVQLDFLCQYDDRIVYRFITEEFFKHEMDNIVMRDGFHGFIYEEFHPNHDYDLRRFSNHFINGVVSKTWSEFEMFVLADTVSLHNTPYSRSGISCLIEFFQDIHSTIELEQFTIHNVSIDLENKKGVVRGDLTYRATLFQKETEQIEGPVILHFEHGQLDWDIVQIEVPGL